MLEKINARIEELRNMTAEQDRLIVELEQRINVARTDRIAMLGGLQELQALATEKAKEA